MEPECKIERNSLIKLIKKYKQFLKHVVNEKQIDLDSNEEYVSLKAYYHEIEEKMLDPDYFHCILGKKFEDEGHILNDNEDMEDIYDEEEVE